MHWVEGLTLNQFVAQHVDKPAMLEALLRLCVKMGKHVRVHGSRVTAVQMRTRCGRFKADLAAIGPKNPRKHVGVSDRCAQDLGFA
jgi:hypothetical protein